MTFSTMNQATTVEVIRALAIGQLANAETRRTKLRNRVDASKDELCRLLIDLGKAEADCSRFRKIVAQTGV